jgi:transmembrane sensor
LIKGKKLKLKQQRKLIRKYLSGTATPNEISAVDNWYNSFQDSIPENSLNEKVAEKSKQFILQKVSRNGFIGRIKPYCKYAAILALVGFIVLLKLANIWNAQENLIIVTTIGKPDTALTMKDGSRVWLKANSELTYDQSKYDKKSRSIKLISGEAYFEIKRNTALPFLVIHDQTTIRVLGTGFNVFTDKQNRNLDVRVSHGLVRVSHNDKSLAYLKKGESLKLNTNTAEFKTAHFNSKYAAAWINERISLKEVYFEELSDIYYNLYRVRLKSMSSSSLKYTYTLDIRKNDNYLSTIAVITSIHQNKFKVQNDTILIF